MFGNPCPMSSYSSSSMQKNQNQSIDNDDDKVID